MKYASLFITDVYYISPDRSRHKAQLENWRNHRSCWPQWQIRVPVVIIGSCTAGRWRRRKKRRVQRPRARTERTGISSGRGIEDREKRTAAAAAAALRRVGVPAKGTNGEGLGCTKQNEWLHWTGPIWGRRYSGTLWFLDMLSTIAEIQVICGQQGRLLSQQGPAWIQWLSWRIAFWGPVRVGLWLLAVSICVIQGFELRRSLFQRVAAFWPCDVTHGHWPLAVISGFCSIPSSVSSRSILLLAEHKNFHMARVAWQFRDEIFCGLQIFIERHYIWSHGRLMSRK